MCVPLLLREELGEGSLGNEKFVGKWKGRESGCSVEGTVVVSESGKINLEMGGEETFIVMFYSGSREGFGLEF
jgi:hypothetical protein